MNEYEKQAKDFLKKTGTELSIKWIRHGKYFPSDNEPRDIYEFTLKRGDREYKGTFGQSINESGIKFVNSKGDTLRHINIEIPGEFWSLRIGNTAPKIRTAFVRWFSKKFFHARWSDLRLGKAPSEYDILAGMPSMRYDEGFDEFCSCFGYDNDSRKAEKIYEACQKELTGLERLFDEKEMNMLGEIA